MANMTRNDEFFEDQPGSDCASASSNGRFQKGKSGNAKGRPKKAKTPKAETLSGTFVVMLSEPIPVTIQGKKKFIPRYEAIAIRLINDLSSGTPQDRLKALQFLSKNGFMDAAKEISDFSQSFRDENTPAGWTEELEERYQLIQGEYEDANEPFSDAQIVDICPNCSPQPHTLPIEPDAS